jgi:hypothetical protein
MPYATAHRVVAEMAGVIPLFGDSTSGDDSDKVMQKNDLFTKEWSPKSN